MLSRAKTHIRARQLTLLLEISMKIEWSLCTNRMRLERYSPLNSCALEIGPASSPCLEISARQPYSSELHVSHFDVNRPVILQRDLARKCIMWWRIQTKLKQVRHHRIRRHTVTKTYRERRVGSAHFELIHDGDECRIQELIVRHTISEIMS